MDDIGSANYVCFVILLLHQYSFNTNFCGFRCYFDPQKYIFIDVQFLVTFCIDRIIGPNLCILKTVIVIESTKIDTHE